jgi:hypothetical protein
LVQQNSTFKCIVNKGKKEKGIFRLIKEFFMMKLL